MNDKEHELLLITQEECAEVTQAISNVLDLAWIKLNQANPKPIENT